MGQEVRTWGMACHLAALAAFIGIPFGNILGPLVIWLIKRHDDPFIEDQGKESLNFQISMTIYGVILLVLGILTFGLGLLLLIPFGIAEVVFVVIAAIRANDGEYYRYPFTIRFIN